jgi:hypothetical protein
MTELAPKRAIPVVRAREPWVPEMKRLCVLRAPDSIWVTFPSLTRMGYGNGAPAALSASRSHIGIPFAIRSKQQWLYAASQQWQA